MGVTQSSWPLGVVKHADRLNTIMEEFIRFMLKSHGVESNTVQNSIKRGDTRMLTC